MNTSYTPIICGLASSHHCGELENEMKNKKDFLTWSQFTCAAVIVGWPAVLKSVKNEFIIELLITNLTSTWPPF